MQKRQRFSAEFKREAVRQLQESGKQVAVLARELGVPGGTMTYNYAASGFRNPMMLC